MGNAKREKIMKPWIKKYWHILFLVGVWLVFLYSYIFKGLIPYPSTYLVTWFSPWNNFFSMPVKNGAMPDVVSQILPWKNFTIETFKLGEWPLWNPYSFSGTPQLANFQSAVLSPINIIFFILPLIDAWTILIVLQPLFAGLFTLFFLRELKIGQAGSLIGSIAFMFCGFMTVWMAYGTMGYAVLFLPLILFAIEKSFNTKAVWPLVIISIALALSVFSGHFQISIYVTLFSLAFTLFKFLTTKALSKTIKVIAFLILGLLLAAPQILPSIELYVNSVRSNLFMQIEVIPWSYLITILAPDFLGNPVTRNDWFGHYAEWASFIGVIPLILAIVVLSFKRTKLIVFFLISALISLGLALPTSLLDLLVKARIPVISTSAASRIIVLFSFSFAVLAAFGLDSLLDKWKDRKNQKKLFIPLFLLVSIVVVIWLSISRGDVLFLKDITPDKVIVAQRNFVLPSVLVLFSAAVIFSGFLIKSQTVKILAIAVLIIVSTFDILRFVNKWMPADPRQFFYPKLDVLTFLAKNVGIDRVFGNFGTEAQVYYQLPAIEGYDPLYIRRYGEFITTASDGKITNPQRSVVYIDRNGKNTKKIFDLLGVKYILHSVGDGRNIWAFPHWKYPDELGLVYEDNKYQIFENKTFLPKAFLAYHYEIGQSDQEIIDKLFSPGFALRKNIILEEKVPFAQTSQDVKEGRVEFNTYTPNKIDLKVNQDQDGILFLSDSFYPGWKAFIDGRESKIYRADYAFRAVLVPRGNHVIKFLYEPLNFKAGLILSFGVIISLTGILALSFFKRKKLA